jgi:hypothetical protein
MTEKGIQWKTGEVKDDDGKLLARGDEWHTLGFVRKG